MSVKRKRFIERIKIYQQIIGEKTVTLLYGSKIIGKFKRVLYILLSKKYKFNEWHTHPVNLRPYAKELVQYLNAQPKGNAVEIGCGLGEIIGNLYCCHREGYDLERCVVAAAKAIYRSTEFRVGTFEDIKNKEIDYLITVNFIHNIPPIELKEKYIGLCRNNAINHLVLDIVQDKNYSFQHNIEFLIDGLGGGYCVKKKLGGYPTQDGNRWVYILEKVKI